MEAAERALVFGIYWSAEDGGRSDLFVFQLVTVDDGHIGHIQDYRNKEHALKAASLT